MDHDLEGNRGRATYSKVQDKSALWEWSGEDRRCKLSDTASLLASRLRGRWDNERTIDSRHGRSRPRERPDDAARGPLRPTWPPAVSCLRGPSTPGWPWRRPAVAATSDRRL